MSRPELFDLIERLEGQVAYLQEAYGNQRRWTLHFQAEAAAAAPSVLPAEATVEKPLTVDEAARMVRTSADTMRYWRYAGKGPRSFKLGRRILYLRQDVDEWIAAERERQG